MRAFIVLIVTAFFTQPSVAVVIDSSKCVVIFNGDDRLKCFDEAVKFTIENGPPTITPPKASEPAASTAAPQDFKVVDPNDIRNTPTKWQGRPIQFNNVRVYWVSDTDVRILTNINLTLFAVKVVGPPEAIQFYKSNCETEREATSQKCRASVRFTYLKHGEDTPSGLMKRTVLISNDVTFVRSQGRR